MSSLFISIIKNKSSSNNYNIYNGFYKKSNHLKIIITTPTTPSNYIINNNNSNNILNNKSVQICNSINIINNRFYTSKSKIKKNKYDTYIHKVNNNVSLAGNLGVKDVNVFSNLKPFIPLKNDQIFNNSDYNEQIDRDLDHNVNSSNVGNSSSLSEIFGNNEKNNSIGNLNQDLSDNSSNNSFDSYNNHNNNSNNSINSDNKNNLIIDNNIETISKNIIEKLKLNENDYINKIEEIYFNPKQYFVYKPLIVIRVKDSLQRKELIQQLRVVMPQVSWKVLKDQPNLVTGNVSVEVYREFIKNHTTFNENQDIKVIDENALPFIGFSKQVLPNSILVDEKSIQAWVEKACEIISSNYRVCKWKRWRIHLITPTSHLAQSNERSQMETLIIRHLKKKHYKDLSSSYTIKASNNRSIPLLNHEALVQIMFTGPTSGYISITTPTIYQYFKKMISIFPSGKVKPLFNIISEYIYRLFSPQLSLSQIHIQTIKNYMNPSQSFDREVINSMSYETLISTFLPSRSFVKLVELFTRFQNFPSMKKNDTVCDLGSSPGGWTLFSLLQGCCVVSIDKANLDTRYIDLENDEDHLIYIKDDAFKFDPIGKFDWLIIDMKVQPIKTLTLLEKWLIKDNCQNFVINLKFDRGSSPNEMGQCEKFIQSNILPLTSYLNSHCLDSNGDKELTLFGINKLKKSN